MPIAITKSVFIEKAITVHGNKYDYSKTEISGVFNLVIIICPVHGEFKQRPNDHYNNNQGCPTCGKESRIAKSFDTAEVFKTKASIKHNNTYDYSLVDYKRSQTKVIVVCPKHGEFLQTPNKHLMGQGCPTCFKKPKKNDHLFYKRSSRCTR